MEWRGVASKTVRGAPLGKELGGHGMGFAARVSAAGGEIFAGADDPSAVFIGEVEGAG